VAFAPHQVSEGEVVEVEHVSEEIGGLFHNLHLNPRQVATSISGRAVIVKRIQMDSMAEELARDTIQFEASDHLPFDIKDVCLDFQILRDQLPSGRMEVLLVAARREVIESRKALLAAAGLSLSAIDVDAFAIQRAYESNYDPPGDSAVVLVHVGDQVTSINVVRDGLPLFVRDIPLATHSFVREVETRQGMTADEARKAVLAEASPTGPLGEAIAAAGEALSMEIERSFAYMRASEEVGPLHQIMLSGEGARIPGLAQRLSDYLRLPVEIADPLRRVTVDPAVLAGASPQEVAPGLMIAVGLALRGGRS
jgi:type IV pilus assembly protein PilM